MQRQRAGGNIKKKLFQKADHEKQKKVFNFDLRQKKKEKLSLSKVDFQKKSFLSCRNRIQITILALEVADSAPAL